MFGYDPIDLADPSPYGALAYYGHLMIGTAALIAAFLALSSRKGGALHRRSGYVYIAAVAIVCLTSVSMILNVFIAPLAMAVFTAVYAVGGAWLALQPASPRVKVAEIGLTMFEIAGAILFLIVALEAVRQGTIPIFAPLVILVIPLILLAGDVNWFMKQDQRKALRIARHLSRMSWGFVVVVRAPLVELAAAGLPVPPLVVVVGPIVLGIAMVWYFKRKYVSA